MNVPITTIPAAWLLLLQLLLLPCWFWQLGDVTASELQLVL
jgi:hypothetical protein